MTSSVPRAAPFIGAVPQPGRTGAEIRPVAFAALTVIPILSPSQPVGPNTGVSGVRERVVCVAGGVDDGGVADGVRTGAGAEGVGETSPAGSARPFTRSGPPAQPGSRAMAAVAAKIMIVRRIVQPFSQSVHEVRCARRRTSSPPRITDW
ncbi:hypothetical protein Asp14428_06460 [Actinoplanes sp. NBRC 14428]|nr:hypothetical protein Asp14428_06460 [Actinoplanes sp. NBRC 14428]